MPTESSWKRNLRNLEWKCLHGFLPMSFGKRKDNMNVIASNVYGKVESIVDLGYMDEFADVVAFTTVESKNNHKKKGKERTVLYKKSDIVFNKDGTFKFRKYKDYIDVKMPDVPWYLYLSDDFFKMIDKGEKYFTDIQYDDYDLTGELLKDCVSISHPSVDNLVFPNHSEHLFRKFKDDVPLSSLMVFDYIGVFNNLQLKYEEAFDYLSKHPYIKKIEKTEIPYYNVEAGLNKGFNVMVKLPQDVYDSIWKKLDKEKYPSCRIKDVVQGRSWAGVDDPLGLKPYMCSNEEQKKKKAEDYTFEERN